MEDACPPHAAPLATWTWYELPPFPEVSSVSLHNVYRDERCTAFCQGTTRPCLNVRYAYSHRPRYPITWIPYDDHFSRAGCKRECQSQSWVQKCCKNHYGRDCEGEEGASLLSDTLVQLIRIENPEFGFTFVPCVPVCPGGVEAPCGNHGLCLDGLQGVGTCICRKGFVGKACELCETGYYGPNCTGTAETSSQV